PARRSARMPRTAASRRAAPHRHRTGRAGATAGERRDWGVRYVLRKLGFYAIAAWAALTINFLLPQLIPGNPVEALIGRMAQSGTPPPGEAKVLTALLGLGGGNIVVKYGRYLAGLVHLRLGLSIADFP